jgi:hypothetical protein
MSHFTGHFWNNLFYLWQIYAGVPIKIRGKPQTKSIPADCIAKQLIWDHYNAICNYS